MKKLLVEYANIIAYTITGLVFGFAFFLLFLNFYHYKEVNDVYIKQESDFEINDELKNKLSQIDHNISGFNINTYQGIEDKNSLSSIQTRLNSCVTEINNQSFNQILNQNKIDIEDVYQMQQFYNTAISNNCIVKQIYPIVLEDSQIHISTLEELRPFMDDHIDQLRISTDYVQKVMKNNSSYYFISNTTKSDVYDQVKDSYYSVLNSYHSAIDFIYDLSVWYKSKVGG